MTTYYQELKKVLTTLHSFSEDLVKTNQLKRNGKVQYIVDFLAERGFSKQKIKNNFDTIIVAGADTSAVTACFALFQLSKRPEIQQKIVDEIETALERYEGNITVSAISEMKYLDSVIKESMRVNAVVPIIERMSGNDVEIDGVVIPKDTRIIFNIQQLHRSEEYFENAECFDPERFLPENVHNKIRKYAYAPFSVEPRDCIGKHLAALLSKYLLIRILRHFDIQPVKPMHTMEIMNKLVITSRNGIPVIFKRKETKCG